MEKLAAVRSTAHEKSRDWSCACPYTITLLYFIPHYIYANKILPVGAEMEKQYDPSIVEDKIYDQWLAEKKFLANEDSDKEAYSIVIPPPNVTGILHMGHALNNTIQDVLIRYKRMNGYETLWMPGTDHAGIATQNVVERKLAKSGTTRHDLGREGFVDEVWKWKEEYHATISKQLKKLGTACDWDRERFTMDDGLSAAVKKVFVKLYEDGLVYRGKYIINWCPRCHTALSDEEAEHQDLKGHLWHFKYPLTDGTGHLTVATTRPETMLGDTAVAVNPKDERYQDLIGKTILLPLVNREIPIIADDFVSREFGSGAVKVTPAHDPNDFQMGQRHDMTPIVIMDETAKMCGDIPEKYIGMDRFEAREQIIFDLEKEGLLLKTDDHDHAVGHCYRCSTVVEPYYSDQWFVKMKPLAEKALAAAVEDKITFFPTRWKRTYIEWMENIRDWCISRQIWWGHRIPVWYCNDCNEITVSEDTPTCCSKCNSTNIRQDEDVLDTWFSSWLWPFSTMGWPEQTKLMDKFYPTNALVTAPEILFFWVARMLMAGLYFTDKLPFNEIVLHGTVRDKSGKKMSKSLGNSIDPLTIIKDYGTDALRFSLIMITAQGADVFLGKDTFDIGRNFANKLWNASRFLLSNIDEKISFNRLPDHDILKTEDKWILSRFNKTAKELSRSIETFKFNEGCHILYDFIWHDFCDWYIEAKKADMYQNDDKIAKETALNISSFILGGILKLLHPIMPFITEEIWGHLSEKVWFESFIDTDSIMDAVFPKANSSLVDSDIEEKFTLIKDIIVSLRTIRSENNVPPAKKGSAMIIPRNNEEAEWIESEKDLINLFVKLNDTKVGCNLEKPKFAGQGVVKGIEVYIELEGLIDKQVEVDRLTKEIGKLKKFAEGIERKLSNDNFVKKAPEAVIAKEREKLDGVKLNISKLEESLKSFQ